MNLGVQSKVRIVPVTTSTSGGVRNEKDAFDVMAIVEQPRRGYVSEDSSGDLNYKSFVLQFRLFLKNKKIETGWNVDYNGNTYHIDEIKQVGMRSNKVVLSCGESR